MAILESVRELASKLGAETNGRDITDQLNKINKHLDETALDGRDIAEAVRTYSKHASGGGGGVGFNSLIATYSQYDGSTVDNGKVIVLKSSTGEYEFTAEDNAIYVLSDPAVTIRITGVDVTDAPTINAISFVAGADSMGTESEGLIKIYVNDDPNPWNSSGLYFSEGDSLVARLRYYSSPGGMQIGISVTNEGVASHTVVIS